MLLVGLTGGIASGKSTVSALLAERGAEVIDADHIARQVVMPGMPAWCKIREHFGAGVLYADGTIDRQALADVVFADKAKLALLNEITHPEIFARIDAQLPPAQRLARADVVIDNSGSLEELGRQVDQLWQDLQRRLAAGAGRVRSRLP